MDGCAMAALKCSHRNGHVLLVDYGFLLDLQRTCYVPEVFGYYKIPNKGDCYLMQLLGHTFNDLRVRSGSVLWPKVTLGSIGHQLIDSVEEFAKFGAVHSDSYVKNLMIGLDNEDGSLSRNVYVIDFDISRRYLGYHSGLFGQIRQMMVSLRHMFDGNLHYWQLNEGKCYTYHLSNCGSAPHQLCDAIKYVCELSGEDQIDFYKIRNWMNEMIAPAEYKGEIIWTSTLENTIRIAR